MEAITKEGKKVKQGDKVTNFRGEEWTFLDATRANDEGHDGKVYVERDGWKQEFYARVFELTVRQ